MSITPEQLYILKLSISGYSFPAVTYDFKKNIKIEHKHINDLEKVIKSQLLSGNLHSVKNGLSNILYWGYAQMRKRDLMVKEFRETITEASLEKASKVFNTIEGTSLKEIKDCEMPEYSNISFISKIRMFLDPENYVVLDLKLMKLNTGTFLRNIKVYETYIPITTENEKYYKQWCDFCKVVSKKYFSDKRAVDIERGIFKIISDNEYAIATEIINNAF